MTKTKILTLSALTLLSFASFSFAATFSFASTTDTLVKGCASQIDVMLDTQGQETTATEMVIVTNDQYDFNQFDVSLGIFPTYTNPKMITDNHLKVLGTTASIGGFNGVGKFGTLVITPKSDSVTLELFMKDGFAGADSNVFLKSTSQDILTSVESKTFKVIEGACSVPTQAEADVKTAEEQPQAVNLQQLPPVLEEITSKNEAIVLPKIKTFAVPSYIVYAVAGLIVLLILILLLRKKKVNK